MTKTSFCYVYSNSVVYFDGQVQGREVEWTLGFALAEIKNQNALNIGQLACRDRGKSREAFFSKERRSILLNLKLLFEAASDLVNKSIEVLRDSMGVVFSLLSSLLKKMTTYS